MTSDTGNWLQAAGGGAGWGSYNIELYAKRQPPLLGTVNAFEIEEKAREKLKDHPESFNYVFGSAGTFRTNKANLDAFDRYKIIPRMLVNATVRNLETTIFGKKYPSPLILAPIGVQGLMHPDAELASAKGAAALNIPYTMSSAASRSIEEIAQASGDGPRFYQLYWPKSENITLSLLDRAKKNGFSALFVTLDTPTIGWRPLDLTKSVMPFFHGLGTQVGNSDPVFMKRFGLEPEFSHPPFPYQPTHFDKKLKDGDEATMNVAKIAFEWMKEISSGIFHSWEDVAFLRKHWEGPIVLKGIQCPEDAKHAIKAGVEGIVISNHGGRQVDGAIASLDALALIMKDPEIIEAQRSGKLTVFFDSGIRTGCDIVKAIALGANAVLLGRPYVYGLALDGQKGVEAVIRSVLADLDITMGLAGNVSIDEMRGKRFRVLMNDKQLWECL